MSISLILDFICYVCFSYDSNYESELEEDDSHYSSWTSIF